MWVCTGICCRYAPLREPCWDVLADMTQAEEELGGEPKEEDIAVHAAAWRKLSSRTPEHSLKQEQVPYVNK